MSGLSGAPAPKNAEPGIPIAASIAWGVLVWPGLVMALFTPMMFDAPGSAGSPQAWFMAAVVVTFPLLCGASIAGSWIVWRVTRRGASRASVTLQAVFALLPAAHVLLLVVFFLFWTFGTPMAPQMHETTYQ
jgi:hypothetical protein